MFIFDTHYSQPLFSSVAIHSNPFAIPCKENWLAGIQANYFARDLGCPDLDLDCMRSKTGREVLAAQRFIDNFSYLYIELSILYTSFILQIQVNKSEYSRQRTTFILCHAFQPSC